MNIMMSERRKEIVVVLVWMIILWFIMSEKNGVQWHI